MSKPHDLKNIGLKATLPRLKILDLFENSDVRHLTAEDVYKILLNEGMEIGLATWRRDGFGYLSLQRPEAAGHFVTRLVEGRVALNVEGVSAASPVTVELLDERDRPVAGYSGAEAARVTEAGTRVAVKWASARAVAEKVAVHVGFPAGSTARVYAVYAE